MGLGEEGIISELELFQKALGIPELELFGVEIEADRVQVRAQVVLRRGMCPGCRRVSDKTHQTPERKIRHLPVFGKPCWITFYERQLECPECGTFIQPMDFLLTPQGRTSRAYGEYLFERVRGCTIKVVAELEGIPEKTLEDSYYTVAKRREKQAKPEPT